MASSLAKHRYFTVVATMGAMDSSAGVSNVLRSRALEQLGEVGLGRLNPVVRFFDGATRTCVVRVDRGSAAHLPALLGGGARVVAASGSLRSCKRRALATLRRRHKAANIRDRALERMEAALHKLH
jgi:RNase P/RNase MRP subunit POP5